MRTLLTLEGLSVVTASRAVLAADIDLGVEAGQATILVGETGAGKSLVCDAVMGTLGPGLEARGRIILAGRDVTGLPPKTRRSLWARDVFLVPQEPWSSLSPTRRAVAQIADVARFVRGAAPPASLRAATGLLDRLGLRADVDGRKRAWELSGGMAQRVAVATALAAPAPLVLADEPTKGLDAALRDRVVALFRTLLEEGRGLLVVTHDLAFAEALGGTLHVMRAGRIVESGPVPAVLAAPRDAFTRDLVRADPRRWPRPHFAPGTPCLELDDLAARVGRSGPELVRGVSLCIPCGAIVGLTGPSGSGKTTLGRAALRLIAPASGAVRWPLHAGMDARRPDVRRRYQKVHQNPGSIFAPWRGVGATLGDALAGAGHPRSDLLRLATPLLNELSLSPDLLARRPDALSGGELQRMALARVLLSDPVFLFADEPTSRLDPLTAAGVAGLLARVAEERRVGILLVSHDPDLVAALSIEQHALSIRGDHPA